MIGGIAHNFRNLIHVIAIGADRLRESTRDVGVLTQCDLIIDVCSMASELVNDIIKVSFVK